MERLVERSMRGGRSFLAQWSLLAVLAVACGGPHTQGHRDGEVSEVAAAAPSTRVLNMVVRTEGNTAAAKGLQTIGVRGAPLTMFNAGLALVDVQGVPHP